MDLILLFGLNVIMLLIGFSCGYFLKNTIEDERADYWKDRYADIRRINSQDLSTERKITLMNHELRKAP